MTENRVAVVLCSTVLLLLGCRTILAQSSDLPAALSGSAPGNAQPARHRAIVTYVRGQIQINANNSSLNQILRDIALQTGMKITGSVADEPVFGRYGPAPADTILATLLEGTGSNFLLTATQSDVPADLILTPRQSVPTPADPTIAATIEPTARPQISAPADTSMAGSSPMAGPGTAARPELSTTNGLPILPQTVQASGTPESPTPNGAGTQQQLLSHIQQLRSMQQASQSPQ